MVFSRSSTRRDLRGSARHWKDLGGVMADPPRIPSSKRRCVPPWRGHNRDRMSWRVQLGRKGGWADDCNDCHDTPSPRRNRPDRL